MHKKLLALSFVLGTVLTLPHLALADTMTNGNIMLNLDSSQDDSTSTSQESDTTDQISNQDVVIRQDFGQSGQEFSFSTDNTAVDYGTFSAGSPVVRTTMLSITPGTSYGYAVFAGEDHELRSQSQNTIPGTTCDNGDCTSYFFGTWENALTYGFGYHCEKITSFTCLDGFSGNLYRQFPNIDKQEKPEVVLTGLSSSIQKAKIVYKTNISTNQAKGSFSNKISFLASPMY